MARCRRSDGRLFGRPARIAGWLVAVLWPLMMMAGYAIVAAVRCCSGSGAESSGYWAMGLVALVSGAGAALVAAILTEVIHRIFGRFRRDRNRAGRSASAKVSKIAAKNTANESG